MHNRQALLFAAPNTPAPLIGHTVMAGPSLVVTRGWWCFQRYTGLMVVCEGGTVMELATPNSDNVDSVHTFRIPDLPVKRYTAVSIKSRLRVRMPQLRYACRSYGMYAAADRRLQLQLAARMKRCRRQCGYPCHVRAAYILYIRPSLPDPAHIPQDVSLQSGSQRH